MFNITGGKGFFIEFKNGYKISVQFGMGNYCENKEFLFDVDYEKTQIEMGAKGSCDAEIAVMDANGVFCGSELKIPGFFESDDVDGWLSPDQVLEVMVFIAALPEHKSDKELQDND
jgi:hypothetical protein